MRYSRLECDYSPSMFARDFQATLSRQARAGHRLAERVRPYRLFYTDDAAVRTNLFVPERGKPSPLMLFIHGGYWQELDNQATDFLAQYYLTRGIAFASLGYGLAPRVSIETMVWQCRQGIALLRSLAGELGLVLPWALGGHSAGAQLACLVAIEEFQDGDPNILAELLLVSGIYDLVPLVGTYVNQALGLDEVRAHRLSPLYHDALKKLPHTTVVVAENDTPAFRGQARDFYRALCVAGVDTSWLDLDGHDHFDVLEDPRLISASASLFYRTERTSSF